MKKINNRLYENLISNIAKQVKKAILESDNTWRGVPGTQFIWHGEWSDPEIIYNDISLNGNEIEDALWNNYVEDCKETGEKPTDDGYEEWIKNEDLEGILGDYAYAAIESKKQEVIDQAQRDLDNLEQAHMLHNKPGKFNRNRKYRNVEGTLYVPGGSHGDPYIVLDGHKINYYDAEDEMWYQYEQACDELDMEPDEELFVDWINGQDPKLIKTWLESLIEK